ncbi:hypothetical protein HY029_02955 [Candidatus Gottesmanbacteria bacterium]|nr:hypothetical protein [Candidatus Gottesmanbacteria bacterium]
MDKLKTIFIYLTPFILLVIALFISIGPDFYRLRITPAGKTFPLVHNHITDYYYYLSLMHQGYEGNWLLTSRMTPEEFKPVFAQTFFALLGHIARVFHLSLVTVYFISRIVSAVLLMLVVILVVRKLFEKKRHIILACLLVFFSTSFWTISYSSGHFSISQFLSFWTRMDTILRTTYLPHHILSTTLGLLSIWFLGESLDKRGIKNTILAGICGSLGGFIYFASMANIIGGVAIAFIIFFIPIVMRQKRFLTFLPHFFIYFAICSMAFFYLLGLARTTFPWSTYTTAGERFTFGFFVREYIGGLGPTLILTILGIPAILSDKKWLPKLLFGWVIFPFIGLLFISRIFWQFADIYYLEAASYIPLGILSVYGWKTLEVKVFKKIRGSSVILTIVLLLYFVPPIITSFQTELARYSPYYYNLYIPNEALDGIKWLDTYTPKESVVLAGGYFGAIIPAFSHDRVVYGHPANTYRSAEKSETVNLFFAQNDVNKAAQIIKRYNVSYIFYGPDTDPPNEKFLNGLGISQAYVNNIIKIFKVIQ